MDTKKTRDELFAQRESLEALYVSVFQDGDALLQQARDGIALAREAVLAAERHYVEIDMKMRQDRLEYEVRSRPIFIALLQSAPVGLSRLISLVVEIERDLQGRQMPASEEGKASRSKILRKLFELREWATSASLNDPALTAEKVAEVARDLAILVPEYAASIRASFSPDKSEALA